MTPLSNIEITEFATLLGGAGAETVTKLLGSAAVVFARNPDQWRKLLDDRGKIPLAVEELLRYEAPSQYNVRRSTREITLHGVTIPAGKPVFLSGASANRDPSAWTDPDTFEMDRDRTQAQNLGLGYGIHSCLGAALARLESTIALDRMLDFMPRYEVDFAACKRVNMQNVAGWSNVRSGSCASPRGFGARLGCCVWSCPRPRPGPPTMSTGHLGYLRDETAAASTTPA